ncbi:PrgI family protein [Hominisplanchenecus murintestinalis]|jgi:hypothetical protein|uniref:PrgI family protein n=1 Tax=Hominisplanchenecus murintestinalis TaxID=2941517 RepID=A0AC61R5F3_9FIRM|nr:PrgI family protein [Hominisplanchenecus murintestinalis]NBH99473.1 PrgI family protein [Lachnospiraceae bacterium]NBI76784.1 PrgI family protein [Lachnospiraceae bacterium]TGY00880.1 PrgI family protein [Hominisplanchenecus murintestinalis]
MHIKINRDFDTDYKDELFRGMSVKETVSLAAGAAVAGVTTFLLDKYAGLPPEVGIYAGVFCAVPILGAGFVSIQGLTPIGYLKEIIYFYRSRTLAYAADELPRGHQRKRAFMEREQKKSCRRKRIRAGRPVPDSGTHGKKGGRK